MIVCEHVNQSNPIISISSYTGHLSIAYKYYV